MTDIAMILDKLGRRLVSDVAPHLEGTYAGGQAGMIGLMAVMAGEAWDGAADRLVREIDGARALLKAGGVEDDTRAESLRIGELTQVRDRLMGQLVALQAKIETDTSETARALNARIWGFFLASAHERMPSPPDFPEPDTEAGDPA